MKSTDIFKDLNDFQAYTDGMIADTSLEQLTPSIRTISHDIIKIITADVYIAICNATVPENDKDLDMEEAAELLKTAVANGAACKYQIFSSVKKNGSEASMYSISTKRSRHIIRKHTGLQWTGFLIGLMHIHLSANGLTQTNTRGVRNSL